MEGLKTVVVDLRSDTVTKPTPEMLRAMVNAEVGDDGYREDPTISKLEKMVAQSLGKEAALFMPSGTMGNLTAIMAHCWERGREMVVGDQSHIYLHEQGGCAQIAGVLPRALKTNPDGTFDLEELHNKIKLLSDEHECTTGVICLENTHNRYGGIVLPTSYVQQVCRIAKLYRIPVHMDGARIVNASVYLGESVASMVKECDSVSMCLSKGLGAPAGTIVAGSADFISRVFRCRKLLGGGMRQVGILGAAGILALSSPEFRLEMDHIRAEKFAGAIVEIGSPLVTVDLDQVQTNIVILNFNTKHLSPEYFVARMKKVVAKELQVVKKAVVLKTAMWSPTKVRCVLHSDISDELLEAAIMKLQYVLPSLEKKYFTI